MSTKFLIFVVICCSWNLYGQNPFEEADSECLIQKENALLDYKTKGFYFQIQDSAITERDQFIDSLARKAFNINIERSIMPLEICGTVYLEMMCYYSTRDSIYTAQIGSDYLNRLLEKNGLFYNKLNGIPIENEILQFPDQEMIFNDELITEIKDSLKHFIQSKIIITLEITSNSTGKIKTINFKLNYKFYKNLDLETKNQVNAVLEYYKSKFTIEKPALFENMAVNSSFKKMFIASPSH